MSFSRLTQWAVAALCAFLVPQVAFAQQEAPSNKVLAPGTEMVVYVPLPEDISPRMKRQEIPLIGRYMRNSALADEVVLVEMTSPAVYASVEPGLVVNARAEQCKNIAGKQFMSYLENGRRAVADDNMDTAKKALKQARNVLPCVERKLGRRQIAELFLFSGLVEFSVGSKAEGERWIRSALSVEEELKDSPLLPAKYIGELERLAFEVDSGEKVDARLSPDQGELWLPRNLVIDGRRMIFDRMFLELVPGYHFIQVSLPDGSSWGTLLEIEAGQIYDVIEALREEFGLRELYETQMLKAIDEGVLEPALAQGLLYYSKVLKKEQLYLARLNITGKSEADLTIRKFIGDDNRLEVPGVVLDDGSESSTGWVPVQFVPPWGTSVLFGFSQLQGTELDYTSSGFNLELDARYLFTQQFYAGASVTGGVRFASGVGAEDLEVLDSSPDLAASAFVGIEIPMGLVSVRTDVGYLKHFMTVNSIPVDCVLGRAQDPTMPAYACSSQTDDLINAAADYQEIKTVDFTGSGAGPRFRLGLMFSPFRRDVMQLQGTIRAAYSPLIVTIPEQGVLIEQDVEVPYEFLSGTNSQLFHRFDLMFGVTATF